jgi:hypothetical protein
MTRRNILRVIAAITVLGFCLVFAACDAGSTNDNNSPSTLSGTYQATVEGYTVKFVFSGNAFTGYIDNVPDFKGTYTISGSTMTFTQTHFYDLENDNWVADSGAGTAILSGDGNSFIGGGVTYTKQQ